jgi:nitroreductase
MLEKIIKQSRCYRKFDEKVEIPYKSLEKIIDTIRFCPSARNQQVLIYKIITDTNLRSKIFPYLKWAGYLPDWQGPQQGERPTAYIIVATNTKRIINNDHWINTDIGIVAQTILLLATEQGFGGCSIGAFNKKEISKIVNAPDFADIKLIIALGKPSQNIKIIEIEDNQSTKYWHKDNIHYVPKRKLKDILF